MARRTRWAIPLLIAVCLVLPTTARGQSVTLEMDKALVIEAVCSPRVVKWSQPPDMGFGVNIRSIELEPIVADDWRCTDPRPVTDVHFWGSYIGWQRGNPNPTAPPPTVDGFWIRIYEDVSADTDEQFPYSHPGAPLYWAEVNEFQREFVASMLHPDETYEHKFYYRLDLPEPFAQIEGTIYWIAISAIMPDDNPPFPWGWETSDHHWNDNATRFWLFNNYWQEITPNLLPPWYSERYRTVDMAFELTVSDETDSDGDGVWDACDNCPNVWNPSQTDTDANGLGNPCQCGDVDGDGYTNVSDALKIARGQVLSDSPHLGKCDCDGDTHCNVADALMIARGQQSSAHEDQLCPAYQGF